MSERVKYHATFFINETGVLIVQEMGVGMDSSEGLVILHWEGLQEIIGILQAMLDKHNANLEA